MGYQWVYESGKAEYFAQAMDIERVCFDWRFGEQAAFLQKLSGGDRYEKDTCGMRYMLSSNH